MENKPILLIGFYNTKALGVRFLERSLIKSGFTVYTLFLKEFNSIRPEEVTDTELQLVKKLVAELDPGLICLSVMSSLYIENVIKVNDLLRSAFSIPIVWGGVFATLFPDKALHHADFVLRGEGEDALVELAGAILGGKYYKDIKNLAFVEPVYEAPPLVDRKYMGASGGINPSGTIVINELHPLNETLDTYSYPIIGLKNKFLINNNRLINEDPLTRSISYETLASRGCPFACSYCSSVNLRRLYSGKGKYVRYRSVESVIGELEEALVHMKWLKVIRFWDEIFPDEKDWIDKFAYEYKTNIRLPFEIWGHPLKTDAYAVGKLAEAGLYKVVMGIQSGSASIRKDIFHRSETQENILNAAGVLSELKVPHIVYDFMLRHPFETEEDIRETYELCSKLTKPFELQLHGLYFLPGTDIIKIAVKKGIADPALPGEGCRASLGEQYKAYWKSDCNINMVNFWYSLIYISQFKTGALLAEYFSKKTSSKFITNIATKLPMAYYPEAKIRYLRKKAILIIRAYAAKIGLKMSKESMLQLSRQ